MFISQTDFSKHKSVKNFLFQLRSKPSAPIREDDTEVVFLPTDDAGNGISREFKAAGCLTMADVWSWAAKKYK